MRPTPYLTGLLAAFPQSAKEDILASFTNGDQDILAFSSRQLDILRLLAAGNSNKQIAKRLELSPNTVKWYVQNLYAELSVNTRLQAVNRVRELGLDL
jgi:LuxR family maltose regulon positive regulatory protein